MSEEKLEENACKSIECGRQVISKGHNPFIPNLFHFVHKGWGESLEEDGWLNLVTEWLRFCDAIWVAEMPPWSGSGVQHEIDIARTLGLVIYYELKFIPDRR